MRHFTLESGTNRKYVVIELRGPSMRVIRGDSTGIGGRSEKELASEAQAKGAADRLAGELVSRGYVEQVSTPATAQGSVVARPRTDARVETKVARPALMSPGGSKGPDDALDLDLDTLAEAADGDSAEVAPLLPRMTAGSGTSTGGETAPPKKKKKKKAKGKQKAGKASGDTLDKRVIAGFVAVGLACLACVGFVSYEAFLKPATIIGHWEGSRLEHEKGKFLTHTSYQLILNDAHQASMTVENNTSEGTYTLKGDQLLLTFKDEDGEESQTAYKVGLGRSTLDLYEPSGDTKVVELIRFRDKSAALAVARTKPAEAPKDLGAAPADPGDDAKLVSVDFASKDAAYRLKRPASWEVESGSRPDNTYSWARFTRDSGKVQVFADVAGSLIAGSNQGDHEEGSELAPVHTAHEHYKRQAMEDYTDYVESQTTVFKGSSLGEGRVAAFTASSGMFGSKIHGVRITFLTNDRRITILAEAPAGQFEKHKPTFLAMARSVAR